MSKHSFLFHEVLLLNEWSQVYGVELALRVLHPSELKTLWFIALYSLWKQNYNKLLQKLFQSYSQLKNTSYSSTSYSNTKTISNCSSDTIQYISLFAGNYSSLCTVSRAWVKPVFFASRISKRWHRHFNVSQYANYSQCTKLQDCRTLCLNRSCHSMQKVLFRGAFLPNLVHLKLDGLDIDWISSILSNITHFHHLDLLSLFNVHTYQSYSLDIDVDLNELFKNLIIYSQQVDTFSIAINQPWFFYRMIEWSNTALGKRFNQIHYVDSLHCDDHPTHFQSYVSKTYGETLQHENFLFYQCGDPSIVPTKKDVALNCGQINMFIPALNSLQTVCIHFPIRIENEDVSNQIHFGKFRSWKVPLGVNTLFISCSCGVQYFSKVFESVLGLNYSNLLVIKIYVTKCAQITNDNFGLHQICNVLQQSTQRSLQIWIRSYESNLCNVFMQQLSTMNWNHNIQRYLVMEKKKSRPFETNTFLLSFNQDKHCFIQGNNSCLHCSRWFFEHPTYQTF